ncbi:ATP-dependent nuclease [Pseudomonas aeruginosa]|uniref:ATP-dependent nuclease n=2 Tax=Pseudomonas aeruginosa TaxID=287 RepID=UPI00148DE2C1|nr:AAA family ATPase [Pseudomonas aeruginosa]
MQLIDQIEIAYFRSIYKESLNNCQNTNIIFGRNDSGKSNTLRGLNLFFNEFTSPGLAFNFERDLNHSRRAEAEGQGDIRKFVYIKLWFNTPDNWKNSLGDRFWVKKQWSVSLAQEAQISTSVNQNRKAYLARFLNKIKLHYIPAIKDRKIFESLQAEIYKVISRNLEFSESLEEFSEALRERTIRLSEKLQTDLEINSVINTPKDLTDLFRSLDFETTSEVGDTYSLTLQRGDGIQVQHIAPILSFLAENSTEDYHIWALEEPENSLELVNAINEANRLRSFGAERNKQIFVTSHSPAFFSLNQEDVARYFVSRTVERANRLCSKLTMLEDPEDTPSELMGETPHLPIISTYLKGAHKKIQQQEKDREELEREIEENNRSIIFVEGASDAIIFQKAWDLIIGEDAPFIFEAAGGTTKMESLACDGRIIEGLAPQRKILALVDNDSEGRSLYTNARLKRPSNWVQHNSNKVHWCRLPFTEEFREVMLELEIPEEKWPGNLENIFSIDVRNTAIADGELQISNIPHAEITTPELMPKIIDFISEREDGKHFYILKTDEEYKERFANWVVQNADENPDILAALENVMKGLARILGIEVADE